ncbi:hypothetical protein OEZ86_008475 [Tetradesmus obliquus]|nr:hypothetical protein OEZ86_008475 [Tetradesmus obliquus]
MQKRSASTSAQHQQQHQQQQQSKQPSWLMPWQTGDRTAGRQVALAVKAKRTPIGGFAHHSLAKAPK